jgi:hypothetical protein
MILVTFKDCNYIAVYGVLNVVNYVINDNKFYLVICIIETLFDIVTLWKSENSSIDGYIIYDRPIRFNRHTFDYLKYHFEWYIMLELCKVLVLNNEKSVMLVFLLIKVVFEDIKTIHLYLLSITITLDFYSLFTTIFFISYAGKPYLGELQVLKIFIRMIK